jgi:drug/metabolite transporter (DMT)-like permease
LLAVLLGLLAAACFGAMTVAVRVGLHDVPDAEAATFVTSIVGLAVAGSVTLLAERDADALFTWALWPFFLAGFIAPGAAGLLFTLGVRLAGAARTAVLITAAPLLAAVPAFLLLDEPFHVALALGAILIVAGAAVLGSERLDRTEFRRIGLVAALAAAALIAVRDNVARYVAEHRDVSGLGAGAAALAGAAVLMLAYLLVTRRSATPAAVRRAFAPFVPAGILVGLAYAALLDALSRGRVTIVTPLYATESFWTVVLASIFLGRSERIGVRVVTAAALMIAGAALIGAFR